MCMCVLLLNNLSQFANWDWGADGALGVSLRQNTVNSQALHKKGSARWMDTGRHSRKERLRRRNNLRCLGLWEDKGPRVIILGSSAPWAEGWGSLVWVCEWRVQWVKRDHWTTGAAHEVKGFRSQHSKALVLGVWQPEREFRSGCEVSLTLLWHRSQIQLGCSGTLLPVSEKESMIIRAEM